MSSQKGLIASGLAGNEDDESIGGLSPGIRGANLHNIDEDEEFPDYRGSAKVVREGLDKLGSAARLSQGTGKSKKARGMASGATLPED